MTDMLCDVNFVRRNAVLSIPSPDMIFLAGSRGSFGGQCRLSSSDYNFVVIGKPVTAHRTINIHHPETGAVYDIVLRDRDGFLAAAGAGAGEGRATLAHRGAYCTLVWSSSPTRGNAFRRACREILLQGPKAMHPQARQRQFDRLKARLEAGDALQDPLARLIERFSLAHQMGLLALRFERQWTGKGKMLGRLLPAHQPGFADLWGAAYIDAANDDGQGLWRCHEALEQKLAVVAQDEPESPAEKKRRAPAHLRNTFRGAFHAMRVDPFSILFFLKRGEPVQREAAQSWLLLQCQDQMRAIGRDRFEARPLEYAAALANNADFLCNTVLTRAGLAASSLTSAQRAALTAQKAPQLYDLLLDAVEGQPAPLQKEAAKILSALTPDANRPGSRIGPGLGRPLVV